MTSITCVRIATSEKSAPYFFIFSFSRRGCLFLTMTWDDQLVRPDTSPAGILLAYPGVGSSASCCDPVCTPSMDHQNGDSPVRRSPHARHAGLRGEDEQYAGFRGHVDTYSSAVSLHHLRDPLPVISASAQDGFGNNPQPPSQMEGCRVAAVA